MDQSKLAALVAVAAGLVAVAGGLLAMWTATRGNGRDHDEDKPTKGKS